MSLLVLQADSQQMLLFFIFFSFPKSRALGNAQVNKILQCCLRPSGFLLLDHCIFLALYSCKDIVMEHKHNNIIGKTFIELVFTVVCTGCKPYSLLPRPMSMLSLLSLHLIPSTVTSNPLQGFLCIFGKLAPPSLNCPVVQPLENLVPGLIGTSLSAALQLCASVNHYCLLASISQRDYFPAL